MEMVSAIFSFGCGMLFLLSAADHVRCQPFFGRGIEKRTETSLDNIMSSRIENLYQ